MSYSLHPPAGTRMVIVGGCGGIGQALVTAAVALDLRVTVLDLAASMATSPPQPGVPACPIDVTDPHSVAAAFAGLTEIDSLVNLAGFASTKTPIGDRDPADWNAVLAANLTGAFLVAQAALPRLRAAARPGAPSTVVNASSGLAARLMPGYGPYGAAKAGLIALTKSLAVENAPHIRANAVAPAAVDTAFLRGGTGREQTAARLDIDAYVRTIPLQRIATAEDVVGPILFLCGPGSGYMTGQVLWINGGALTP
jgi:3-oxoacyl-[acyl-carrier protein] reductase